MRPVAGAIPGRSLGRNRSGKTGLCRLIAGLEAAGGGSIVLDGQDITRQPPGARSVALVYQAFVNYPNLTVFENIASPLRAQRRPRAEVRERVSAIAAQLQLAPLLERLPAQLSGGQQQRLAIGRALAKSARVLLLDEPLVNLDYKLREALEYELRAMLHAEGLTVIYTTSDPRDAFNLADEVVLLDDHRIVQAGAPLEVYQRPCTPAAAELMSDPGVNRFRDGGTLCVVRPEHLTLTPESDAARQFDLAVLGVETNGSETYLHGTMADDHWVAKLQGLHRVEAGQRVSVYAPEEALLRFEGALHG
ncbi:MAG: ABC transporter ATP-binding protein [Gammaproteobacteria bacterium]|nr:ABC transporter ATP-binding protein [Gammaproteobacteria bacterium]